MVMLCFLIHNCWAAEKCGGFHLHLNLFVQIFSPMSPKVMFLLFCYVLALDTIFLSFLKDFTFYYLGILLAGCYACRFYSGLAVNGHISGAGEMTQGPRVFTPLAEDLTLGPSTQVDWLTAACNYSFRRSDALFSPLWAPALMCTHVGISTHVHPIKNSKIKSSGMHGYFHIPDSCRVKAETMFASWWFRQVTGTTL